VKAKGYANLVPTFKPVLTNFKTFLNMNDDRFNQAEDEDGLSVQEDDVFCADKSGLCDMATSSLENTYNQPKPKARRRVSTFNFRKLIKGYKLHDRLYQMKAVMEHLLPKFMLPVDMLMKIIENTMVNNQLSSYMKPDLDYLKVKDNFYFDINAPVMHVMVTGKRYDCIEYG
jgi:hypothetical protein